MAETKDKFMSDKPPWFLLILIIVAICALEYFFPGYTVTTLKWVVIVLGGVVLSIPSLIVTGLLTNFFERPLVGKVGGLAVGLVIAACLWWLWHQSQ